MGAPDTLGGRMRKRAVDQNVQGTEPVLQSDTVLDGDQVF